MAITYSIDGGADAAKFNINATSGALTFKTAPDFEIPGDANADNIYEVSVKATDAGGLASSKLVKVTVTDVSEGSPPQITSAGAVSVKENSTTVMTITATDPDDVTQPPITAVTHGQQIVLGQNVGRVGAKNAAIVGYSDTMTTITGAKTYNTSQTFNNVNFTGMVTVAGGTVVFNFCTFTTQPTSATSSSGAALNQFNGGNACGVVTCNWCDFDTGLRGSQGNFETEGFHAGQRLATLTNQLASSFTLYRCRIQGYGNGVVVCAWQCGMCYITECYIGECTAGGGSHMDGVEIYGSDNVTVQRCRMVGVSGGQCVLGNVTNDMINVKNFNPIVLKDNMVLPKGDNAPVLIARNNNSQSAKRNVSVTGNYWGDNTNWGFTVQLAGNESPMTGLNVTSDKTYFDANQATNTPGLVYWSGNVWSPNGEGVTKHTPGAAVSAADFSNGSAAWNGKMLPSGGTEPPIEPPVEPPVSGAITHGSELTASMTGPGALGITTFEVMSEPSRGYWRGDAANEFSLSTPYVYNNNSSNKGGVVPSGGMVIDGYTIPAGTVVVQARDFSASSFYLTNATSFMFRGCRLRGRSTAPGYFNCAAGQAGKLYFFFNDLGGLGSASGDFNEIPIKIANGPSVTIYRNRVQFTTTAFQCNIGGPIEITENFVSDLTTFGTSSHLNGITHNGGENNSQILRNNIVVRSPDTSGRTVNQTDCVSFFQDFGDFSGSSTKKIDSNYLGGTGYCIYAGMNAGKPSTSVKNMVVTNNLITTQVYSGGGSFGAITAVPPWGTNGNIATNNRWADGSKAGQLAFGS